MSPTTESSFRWFLSNQNNGIIAVVSEEHARLGQEHPDFRIFTFCPDEYFRDQEARLYYTGTHSDLEKIRRVPRISIRDIYASGSPHDRKWTGFVPYSNQEHRMDLKEEDRQKVTRWKTTLSDFVRAFGTEAIAALAET